MKTILRLLVITLILSIVVACTPTTPPASPQPSTPTPSVQPKPSTPTPTPTPVAPIKLKAAAFSGTTQADIGGWFALKYYESVTKKSNGRLDIQFLGGSELMKGEDQPAAVQKGIIDMTIVPMSWYQDMPEGRVAQLSELSPTEERKPGGLYDLWVKSHERVGLRYLGRTRSVNPSNFGVNVAVTNPRDGFKGMKIRTIAQFNELFKTLGIAGVTMAIGDVYSGMERGLIQGWAHSFSSAIGSYNLQDVTKYWVDHALFSAGNQVIIMNLAKFNSLPPDLQKLMIDAMADEIEPAQVAAATKALDDSKVKALAKGMKPITFSEADAKWLSEMTYKSEWDAFQKLVTPEVYNAFYKAAHKP